MVSCNECPNGQPRAVKIVFSVGMVALAFLCAVFGVIGERVAQRVESGLGFEAKQSYTPGGVSYDDGKTATLNQMPVNEAAAREVKKQSGAINTGNFMQSVPSSRPSGNKAFPLAGSQYDPFENSRPSQPKPTGDPVKVVSTPTASRFNVSVFVATDRQSQDLLAWFDTNENLKALKSQCNYQAYTRDNALYKERFASIVSASEFPAVVVSDPQGGHVYAAGASMLPRTAADLYAEIYDGFQVYSKVAAKPSEPTPINAEVASAAERPDCPDGQCVPADRQPFLNPDRERLLPLARPRKPDTIENLFHVLFYPIESMASVLCFLVIAVAVFIVFVKVIKS